MPMIELDVNEYPQLRGKRPGDEINFTVSGTVSEGGKEGMIGIEVQDLNMKTDNLAQQEVERLTGQRAGNKMPKRAMVEEEEEL